MTVPGPWSAPWIENPSICHNQLQSPLFGALPAEIRNQIFDIVLRPVICHPCFEETQNGLKDILNKWGHDRATGAQTEEYPNVLSYVSIETALLQTCRLIYAETRLQPIRNSPHVWYRLRAYYPALREPYYGSALHVDEDWVKPSQWIMSHFQYRAMYPHIRSQISEITLYDIKPPMVYPTFLSTKNIRPTKVTVIIGDHYYPPKMIQRYSNDSPWHAELMELKIRFDATPEIAEHRENYLRRLVPLALKKSDDGLLKVTDKPAIVAGTWRGFNLSGDDIHWRTFTAVWRAVST